MKRTESKEFAGLLAVIVAAGLLLAASVLAVCAVHLGNLVEGSPQRLPGSPVGLLTGLLTGRVEWRSSATVALVTMLLLLLIAGVALAVLRRRRYGKRTRVDYAARHMGTGRSIAALGARAARASSARLGVPGSGLEIGETVHRHRPVFAGWEDMWLIIAGPRTGKTTSAAVPTIAAAPGALIVTSNKPDIVQDTRAYRAGRGRVWVFNPQQVTADRPEWWWDPLSSVVDDVAAEKLARHFASGSREPGAKTDAYFDNAGVNLLKALLLAAAVGGRSILHVAAWLNDAEDREPLMLLDRYGERWLLIRDSLADAMSLPVKQRAGVYGTAQQMASCLSNSHIAAWVSPLGEHDRRPRFDHRAFVTSSDTLYSLSREGAGTAGPLVLALTAAVIEEAERHASQRPAGRMEVPLVGVLDEAANVCRWANLPDLYSHFGSRGIIIQTILQSWSQGVDVWGESGMKKLWSAANIKLYLGGVGETQFLQMLSESIGDREIRTSSVSSGKGTSVSSQRSRDRILDVSELQSFPRGRAVLLASGCRPALVRTIPWWKGPHAAELGSRAGAGPAVAAPAAEQASEPRFAPEPRVEGRGQSALAPAAGVRERPSESGAATAPGSSWSAPPQIRPGSSWSTGAGTRPEAGDGA